MTVTSRLNRVVATLEAGQRAFAAFASADPAAAVEFSTSAYDALVFETEHKPWDIAALRDSFQYLLNRKQIFEAETVAPAITPIVRIPPNGSEKAQWHAKQALDLGAFGIVWPHISTADEAYNAVAACRYPKLRGHPRYERRAPAGTARQQPAATGGCRAPSTTREAAYGRSTPTARSSWPS